MTNLDKFESEVFISEDTLPEAYHEALKALYYNGQLAECQDWNTTQKEISVTIEIKNPLKEPMISKLFIGGPRELELYVQEMLDGILNFEILRGNWTYTYHDRMVNYPVGFDKPLNQIQHVVNILRDNPSSRRAVIDIRDNRVDATSDDPACLQHIQYFIRDGKLNCKVLFRSNDACKATFMNAFALILLQKKIADELDVEMGTYVHRANSFHCYAKDFEMLNGYVKRLTTTTDNTYSYVDDWKELMEDYIPTIRQLIDNLKHN